MGLLIGRRVALVTGASSGIGQATARELAHRGYTVVATARRPDRLRALDLEINGGDGEALTIPGDITDSAFRVRLVRETLERYERLDVLVNVAGAGRKGTIETMPSADVRLQFELNVLAPLELIRLTLPSLRASAGVIVNVASIVSQVAMPPLGTYSATKFALAGATETLRRELMGSGVRVCQINPGPVLTEFAAVAGLGESALASFGIAPERVARAIARTLRHPRRLVTVPWGMALVVKAGQIAPGLADVAFRLLLRFDRAGFFQMAAARPAEAVMAAAHSPQAPRPQGAFDADAD